MSRINTIIDAVVTALQGVAGATTVTRRREEPFAPAECPVIEIRYRNDNPTPIGLGRVKRELWLDVSVLVRGTNAEAEAIDLMAAAHAALCKSGQLGGLLAKLQDERGEAQSDDMDIDGVLIVRSYKAVFDAADPEL